MAKKWVKLLVGFAGLGYGPAGSTVELGADEADRFVEKGYAEPILVEPKGTKQTRTRKAKEKR